MQRFPLDQHNQLRADICWVSCTDAETVLEYPCPWLEHPWKRGATARAGTPLKTAGQKASCSFVPGPLRLTQDLAKSIQYSLPWKQKPPLFLISCRVLQNVKHVGSRVCRRFSIGKE